MCSCQGGEFGCWLPAAAEIELCRGACREAWVDQRQDGRVGEQADIVFSHLKPAQRGEMQFRPRQQGHKGGRQKGGKSALSERKTVLSEKGMI